MGHAQDSELCDAQFTVLLSPSRLPIEGAKYRSGTAQLFTTKLLQMDLDNDHKLR